MRALKFVSLVLLLGISVCEETKEQIQQHKNDFISFDQNSDGNVDAQEVRNVYPNIKQDELSAFFIATDKNQNGLIDFDEYSHASLEHADGNLNLEEFQVYWS